MPVLEGGALTHLSVTLMDETLAKGMVFGSCVEKTCIQFLIPNQNDFMLSAAGIVSYLYVVSNISGLVMKKKI